MARPSRASETPDLTWFHKVRLRILAFAFGIVLAALAVISLTGLPALPIVGVALATVAMIVNGATARLNHPTCLGCGADMSGEPEGQYGVVCKSCGTVGPAGMKHNA